MKTKKIVIFLALLLILFQSAFAAEHFYEVKLVYDRGNISNEYTAVQILREDMAINNLAGRYSAEIVSSDGSILNITKFRIPLTILYDNFDENGSITGGGEITLNQTTQIIALPYYENAKEINIYDENLTKKLTIEVTMYAKNITTEKETTPTPQANATPARGEGKTTNTAAIIAITAAIIIAIIIIVLRKKKNE